MFELKFFSMTLTFIRQEMSSNFSGSRVIIAKVAWSLSLFNDKSNRLQLNGLFRFLVIFSLTSTLFGFNKFAEFLVFVVLIALLAH